MSYTLDAFIGPAATLQEQIVHLPNTKLVLLEQGIAMAPILYPIPRSKAIEPFWNLTNELFELGVRLSTIGPIGYLQIELFGGYGERTAVLWENQKAVFGPIMSEDSAAISNEFFSLLGVKKQHHHDEFDALNLSRYRSNEGWLTAN